MADALRISCALEQDAFSTKVFYSHRQLNVIGSMVPLIQNEWDGGRARLNSRRRLGRATAAQRLGFRQYSREDSERARRARFESSRDHRARTDRSPVIGLSSTACRTLPEEQLLRPIAGERSVLVRWSREDSKRAR